MGSDYLAMIDNYHLTRKNAIYLLASFTDICGEDGTSPAGDTGKLNCAPRPPPRKDKSTAYRGHHSPATARKGGTQGKGQGGRADSAEFLAGVDEGLEVKNGPGVVCAWGSGLFTFI